MLRWRVKAHTEVEKPKPTKVRPGHTFQTQTSWNSELEKASKYLHLHCKWYEHLHCWKAYLSCLKCSVLTCCKIAKSRTIKKFTGNRNLVVLPACIKADAETRSE